MRHKAFEPPKKPEKIVGVVRQDDGTYAVEDFWDRFSRRCTCKGCRKGCRRRIWRCAVCMVMSLWRLAKRMMKKKDKGLSHYETAIYGEQFSVFGDAAL